MTVPCTNDVTPVSDWWHAGLPLACVSCHGVARPCADSGFAGTIRMQSVAAGGGVGVGVGFDVGFGLGWLFNPAAEAAPPACGDILADRSNITLRTADVCDSGATAVKRRPNTTAPRIFKRICYPLPLASGPGAEPVATMAVPRSARAAPTSYPWRYAAPITGRGA